MSESTAASAKPRLTSRGRFNTTHILVLDTFYPSVLATPFTDEELEAVLSEKISLAPATEFKIVRSMSKTRGEQILLLLPNNSVATRVQPIIQRELCMNADVFSNGHLSAHSSEEDADRYLAHLSTISVSILRRPNKVNVSAFGNVMRQLTETNTLPISQRQGNVPQTPGTYNPASQLASFHQYIPSAYDHTGYYYGAPSAPYYQYVEGGYYDAHGVFYPQQPTTAPTTSGASTNQHQRQRLIITDNEGNKTVTGGSDEEQKGGAKADGEQQLEEPTLASSSSSASAMSPIVATSPVLSGGIGCSSYAVATTAKGKMVLVPRVEPMGLGERLQASRFGTATNSPAAETTGPEPESLPKDDEHHQRKNQWLK
eukprot:PhM_4_TR18311/c0_g1_i1/m.105031